MITLSATGTAPQVAADTDATLDFTTTIARANGSVDPTPENDAPPPAQTVVRGNAVCKYTMNPRNVSVSAFAQSVPVKLVSRGGCAWTADSDSPWLSTTPSGSGNSTLPVAVQANPTTQTRTGTLTINGTQLFVVQAGNVPSSPGNACSNLRLQREGDQTPAAGLTGPTSVGVLADGQCGWTAQANAQWVTLTAGGGGNGNGTVSYVAQPNDSSDARSAMIMVNEKQFVVNQLGNGTNPQSGGSDGGGDSGGSSGGDSGGGSGGDSG